jgi:2,4-dienoyl-CoA reductase-like NADH-dependent reductase (Old Yellow Enzyme family)
LIMTQMILKKYQIEQLIEELKNQGVVVSIVIKMEQLLNSTNIGYFGMARPFLSEPNLSIHYEKDSSKRTRCVSCNACLNSENVGSCILNQNV